MKRKALKDSELTRTQAISRIKHLRALYNIERRKVEKLSSMTDADRLKEIGELPPVEWTAMDCHDLFGIARRALEREKQMAEDLEVCGKEAHEAMERADKAEASLQSAYSSWGQVQAGYERVCKERDAARAERREADYVSGQWHERAVLAEAERDEARRMVDYYESLNRESRAEADALRATLDEHASGLYDATWCHLNARKALSVGAVCKHDFDYKGGNRGCRYCGEPPSAGAVKAVADGAKGSGGNASSMPRNEPAAVTPAVGLSHCPDHESFQSECFPCIKAVWDAADRKHAAVTPACVGIPWVIGKTGGYHHCPGCPAAPKGADG